MLAILTFLLYTSIVGAITYWFTRREKLETSDGYFLGGRSLNGWVIAGSLMLTNLSTEHLIGLNADAYRYTVAVMAWETTAALAMVLMALYFLPKYLNLGLTTIPEFLTRRYDQSTQFIASLLFLLSYAIAILPIVLLFGASGLEELFDVSTTWGVDRSTATWMLVWGVGILGSLYAVLGGLRAVAISDTVNGIGFLLAGLLIPYLALRSIGAGDLWAGMTQVYQEHPEKFDITGDEPGSFLPMGVLFTGMIVNQVFFWCTNQSIVQRALGARSLAEGQKGVLLAGCFKLIGPLIIVLPGVIAFHLFADELGEEGAMLAYPRLVKHVLPTALTGFFAAVMVGAILSTFNSVLNSSATLFSQGIYTHLFCPDASELQKVRAGRICSVVLAVAAMTIAPTIDTTGSLYEYLQQINATFFGPMLAVILLGMLTRWATPLSAKVTLILGPIVFYVLVFGRGEQVQSFLRHQFSLQSDVHFLHLLAVVFSLAVIGMGVISWWKPGKSKTLPTRGHYVDMTPWRLANHVSAFVVIVTLLCYMFLAA
ncbi:MAG: solute:sodium symporter family transporter [Planctomycetes bacterium]|nr:solute:sodium symporter family transporter [Planctomycetota bacterium]